MMSVADFNCFRGWTSPVYRSPLMKRCYISLPYFCSKALAIQADVIEDMERIMPTFETNISPAVGNYLKVSISCHLKFIGSCTTKQS